MIVVVVRRESPVVPVVFFSARVVPPGARSVETVAHAVGEFEASGPIVECFDHPLGSVEHCGLDEDSVIACSRGGFFSLSGFE